MATTIKIKNSVTATTTPTSLVQGEVAINVTDKKVWVGNAATTPIQIVGAGTTGNAAGSNNQVQYNSSGSFAGDADFTFNGTTVTMANDASISGLTVGKGGGAVSNNNAIGTNALAGSNSGVGYNTAVGNSAGFTNTTGAGNLFVGYQAGNKNTTGSGNSFVGGINSLGAGYNNTTGSSNTAFGSDSLASNTTASNNTAVGYQSLYANTTGADNTAVGRLAANANTTGASNVAMGNSALVYNTTGSYNVAVGQQALNSNTTASNNTAVGYQAAFSNTTATNITAVGYFSLYSNTTGVNNTAVGMQSLDANTTGDNNTAIGVNALGLATTGSSNTAIGLGAGGTITTGSKNTIVGRYDGNQGGLDIRTASNHIVLSDGDGNPRAYWNGTGQATFTATSGTGLSVVNNYTGNGTPLILTQSATNTFNACEIRNSSATAVFIVAANGNATNTNNSYGGISDAKLKENIVDATPKLDKLMQVKVRNYNLKGDDLKQIGVVAQELEQVFPSLIEETIDKDADDNNLETTTKSVKYSVFVPMLIKAVQELKAEVDSLKQQLGK